MGFLGADFSLDVMGQNREKRVELAYPPSLAALRELRLVPTRLCARSTGGLDIEEDAATAEASDT